LDFLVKEADFISLHCPLSAETHHLVDKGFLAQMKRGAFLVNTSRGDLLNETSIYDSLQENHLGGVALDTFSEQPPKATNPLLSLSQVIATPHVGAHTDGAAQAMGWGALNNCLAVLRGQEPENRVI
jgi:phosphoglycerate dehydrogenase-like enzyme